MSQAKKVTFIFMILFFVMIAAWIWYYGANYLLPLPETPIIRKNAIQMPIGKFFLVREGNRYAAIRILRATWSKGAVYECYSQGDDLGNFNSKSATHKKGKVCERYKESRISPSEVMLRDNGSRQNIECGQFSLEWSNQNWVYLKGHGTDQPIFELATTAISNVTQLNVKDKNLQWISGTERQK
jgi:hypothetical protein